MTEARTLGIAEILPDGAESEVLGYDPQRAKDAGPSHDPPARLVAPGRRGLRCVTRVDGIGAV